MKKANQYQKEVKELIQSFRTKKMTDIELQGYEALMNINDYLLDYERVYLPLSLQIDLNNTLTNLKKLGF